MKNLTLSSLSIVLLLTACAPNILNGFRKSETKEIAESDLYPIFRQSAGIYFFNMGISFRKNNFSGMLILKKETNDTYRAVMNSYFGMSVFDMEFGKDFFTVHYCIEGLNKKRIINTLRNDFENLFFFEPEEKNQATVYLSPKNDSLKVYKIKKDNHYYMVNTESKELLRMEIPGRISDLRYRFSDYGTNRFPSQINIKHTNIGLEIRLTGIEQ